MSPKRRARSVEADTLETLRRRGAESGVLDARLAWSELEGIRRYVADMAGRARIVPLMLPTAQASGRWSTTQPPLTNWPRHDPQECPGRDAHSEAWCPLDVRGLLLPDPGTYWVKFDWDAVEARLAATYTQDPDDLAAFANGWDIHTLTLCRMLSWDTPPVLSKRLHLDDTCRAWREAHEWGGPDDRRRHLAKTVRYALLYAEDHRGVLSAKGVEKLGYTKAQLEDFGRAYLRAKPAFVAAKSRVQAECGRTGLARSAFGRLRRLSGDASTRGKEGWSHTISATVSDMMNTVLIGIHAAVPECWLVVNRHDGAEIAFPASVPVERAHGALRGLVEREWSFWGHAFRCPATWEVVDAEGEHQRL